VEALALHRTGSILPSHTGMSDPLSIAVSVAGLIQLAQSLIPVLVRYVDDVRSYPIEFSKLTDEIRGFSGVLCLLQPVIEKMEARSSQDKIGIIPLTGSFPPTCIDPINVLSLQQLQDCRATLVDFADLLEKHKPPASGKVAKCFKALVWSLKNGDRGNVLSRLERQKGILQLALLGISMFVSYCCLR